MSKVFEMCVWRRMESINGLKDGELNEFNQIKGKQNTFEYNAEERG